MELALVTCCSFISTSSDYSQFSTVLTPNSILAALFISLFQVAKYTMDPEQTDRDSLAPYIKFELQKQELAVLQSQYDLLSSKYAEKEERNEPWESLFSKYKERDLKQQDELDKRETQLDVRFEKLQSFDYEIHLGMIDLSILDQTNKSITSQDLKIWDALCKMDADLTLALKKIVMSYSGNMSREAFTQLVLKTLNDPQGLGSPQTIPLPTPRLEIQCKGEDYIEFGSHVERNIYH